jgi:hypothetical protein
MGLAYRRSLGGSAKTVSFRFDVLLPVQSLGQRGILRKILKSLARHLAVRGQIDWDECFIDGTFSVAKKGATRLATSSGAKV